MNNFIFQNSTKVYFGKGCVKEYLACLTKEANVVMLAYGGGSIKRNGIYEEVAGILQAAGKTIVEFPGIMANPTYAKVQEGARLARENRVDLILAVGGGSAMDCCKAVSLAARYEGDIWEDFWAQPGVVDFEPLTLGVIVTVAGTGGECNGGAVITHEEKKVKTGRDYPACNPRFALMDPTYTYSVPMRQMVSGGFDILSHIMETYFSEPNEDNVSDGIIEALMKSVIRNLRASIQNPEDYTARSNLMWDSTMAENRLIKMGKSAIFSATTWNISWALIPIATMAAALPCCTPYITVIFTGTGCRSLCASLRMYGEFPETAEAMRRWPRRVCRRWPALSRNLACPPH